MDNKILVFNALRDWCNAWINDLEVSDAYPFISNWDGSEPYDGQLGEDHEVSGYHEGKAVGTAVNDYPFGKDWKLRQAFASRQIAALVPILKSVNVETYQATAPIFNFFMSVHESLKKQSDPSVKRKGKLLKKIELDIYKVSNIIRGHASNLEDFTLTETQKTLKMWNLQYK
jgi:hypothetical protein